jgi:hypothetical protein
LADYRPGAAGTRYLVAAQSILLHPIQLIQDVGRVGAENAVTACDMHILMFGEENVTEFDDLESPHPVSRSGAAPPSRLVA